MLVGEHVLGESVLGELVLGKMLLSQCNYGNCTAADNTEHFRIILYWGLRRNIKKDNTPIPV